MVSISNLGSAGGSLMAGCKLIAIGRVSSLQMSTVQGWLISLAASTGY